MNFVQTSRDGDILTIFRSQHNRLDKNLAIMVSIVSCWYRLVVRVCCSNS